MKALVSTIALAFLVFGSAPAYAGESLAKSPASLPSPKTSYYTERILRILNHWPPPTVSLPDPKPVIIRAIRTPGDPDMIGFIKTFEVPFPIATVARAEDDFEQYPKIWSDVLSVKVDARDGNRLLTSWVRRAPAFFLSKIRYRLLYTIDRSNPNRIVYHQQLIDGNSVSTSDSLIILERLAKKSTRITVLVFFTPELGALRSLIGGTIWIKSIQGSFKDDLCFTARLEHPDWSADQISDAADRIAKNYPIREVQYVTLPELRD